LPIGRTSPELRKQHRYNRTVGEVVCPSPMRCLGADTHSGSKIRFYDYLQAKASKIPEPEVRDAFSRYRRADYCFPRRHVNQRISYSNVQNPGCNVIGHFLANSLSHSGCRRISITRPQISLSWDQNPPVRALIS
jgi:hypothetical protein